MNKSERLGTVDVKKLVIMMSAPAALSMLVQALYNVVDSVFVSWINEEALAAVSLSFPLQMIIIAICVGIGIGINSVISRRLGEGNKDEAVNAAEHGFFIGVFLYIIIALCAIKLPRMFFENFTDNQLIIDYAVKYITIIMVCSFGRIFSQVCMSILQATGDMVSSMWIQLVGAITNLILDPLLIFGILFFPELGIAGAAVATIIGQLASMSLAFIFLFRNKKGLKLDLRKFHYSGSTIKTIIVVGIPAAIMQGLSSVMIAGLNMIVSKFGDTPYAVLGAYYKLQSFIFMPIFGVTMGIMPIIGYNFGAGNKQRIIDTVKFALKIVFGIMVIGTLVFQFAPEALLGLFKASDEMKAIGIPAFRILSSGFVLAGCSIVFSTCFQALGDAYISMILSFIRQVLVLLPCAYFLSIAFGLNATWIAFPIAEVVTIVVLAIFAISVYNKKVKNLQPIQKVEQ